MNVMNEECVALLTRPAFWPFIADKLQHKRKQYLQAKQYLIGKNRQHMCLWVIKVTMELFITVFKKMLHCTFWLPRFYIVLSWLPFVCVD